MPASPPAMNGDTRRGSMFLRWGQSVAVCKMTPAPVTMIVECNGSMRCSQIEEAASAKAKPEPPAAMPPSSAPSHSTAMVSNEKPPSMSSAEIEDEDEPGGAGGGSADGDEGGGPFAEVEEFDGEDAQPERHVQRQRRDETELGCFHPRISRQCQEGVERAGA